VAALIGFSIVSVIFFHDSLSGDFMFRDAYHEYFTLNVSLSRPGAGVGLWLQDTALGYPPRGSGFPAVWYPVNLILRAAPVSWSVAEKLYVLFHFALAGAAMFFMLRRLGVKAPGALAGAVGYAFSGYLVCQHYAMNLVPGHALFPLVIGTVAAGRGSLATKILGGLLAGMILLGGDPQGFGLAVAAGSLFLLFGERSESEERVARSWLLRKALPLVVFIMAALLGSAAELFPMLDVARETGRASGVSYDDAVCWSFHPLRVIEFLLSRPFGDPFSGRGWWGGFMGERCFPLPLVLSPYLGAWTLIAALAAIFRTRLFGDRRVLLFTGMAVFFLLLAMGGFLPLYKVLFQIVPGMSSFRYPEKHLFMVSFCMAALSGIGTDLIAGEKSNGGGKALAKSFLAPALVLVLAGAAWLALKSGAQVISGWLTPLLAESFVELSGADAAADLGGSVARALAAISISWLVLVLLKNLHGRAIAFLPALVLFVDLFLANATLAPTARGLHDLDSFLGRSIVRRAEFCDETRDPECLSPESYRLARDPHIPAPPDLSYAETRRWERHTLKPNLAATYGLEYFAGHNVAAPARLRWVQAALLDFPRLPIYSVKWAVVEAAREPAAGPDSAVVERYRGASLIEFRAPYPRAYWIGRAKWAPGDYELRDAYMGHDFATEVILEGEHREDVGEGGVRRGLLPAEITSRSPTLVTVEVSCPVSGWLVLNDAFRKGWSAEVDGVEAPIYRANALVRAVRVPAGGCEVEFSYRPPGLVLGLVLTGLGWGLLLLTGIARKIFTTDEHR